MNYKNLLGFAFLFISYTIITGSSCGSDGTGGGGALSEFATAKTMLDQSYGADAQQKMDIYLPANRSTTATKVIVMVHGGGWIGGDKSEFNATVAAVKLLWPEVAIINMNYRLATATTNKHPAQINDMQTVINYIITNKATLGVSDKLGLVGASAGAHLSLLYGYSNNTGNYVKAIADVFGPTNFNDALWYSNPIAKATIDAFLGTSQPMNPTLFTQASPLFAVRAGVPPTIIFHGTADIVVPIAQSDSLVNRLQTNSITHAYYKYPGEGHGFSDAINADAINKAVAFLKIHIN
jgi:acetyl esterase/lipase